MADKEDINSDFQPKIDDLISSKEAAAISGLSQGHLGLLIRSGVIWGKKIGRNWVTSKQVLENYLATQPKPGPKPRKRP